MEIRVFWRRERTAEIFFLALLVEVIVGFIFTYSLF